MELMLDIQKSFEEKLEALKEENNAMKVQLNGQKNDSEEWKFLGSLEKREKAIRKT